MNNDSQRVQPSQAAGVVNMNQSDPKTQAVSNAKSNPGNRPVLQVGASMQGRLESIHYYGILVRLTNGQRVVSRLGDMMPGKDRAECESFKNSLKQGQFLRGRITKVEESKTNGCAHSGEMSDIVLEMSRPRRDNKPTVTADAGGNRQSVPAQPGDSQGSSEHGGSSRRRRKNRHARHGSQEHTQGVDQSAKPVTPQGASGNSPTPAPAAASTSQPTKQSPPPAPVPPQVKAESKPAPAAPQTSQPAITAPPPATPTNSPSNRNGKAPTNVSRPSDSTIAPNGQSRQLPSPPLPAPAPRQYAELGHFIPLDLDFNGRQNNGQRGKTSQNGRHNRNARPDKSRDGQRGRHDNNSTDAKWTPAVGVVSARNGVYTAQVIPLDTKSTKPAQVAVPVKPMPLRPVQDAVYPREKLVVASKHEDYLELAYRGVVQGRMYHDQSGRDNAFKSLNVGAKVYARRTGQNKQGVPTFSRIGCPR